MNMRRTILPLHACWVRAANSWKSKLDLFLRPGKYKPDGNR